MKVVLTSLFLISITTGFSYCQQIDYNIQDGYIAGGYDVVSYFENNPVKGNSDLKYEYDGVIYLFATLENLELFKSNPRKYIPQYGGWCAYAMGKKGEKVSVDPGTYEIRDGHLYLFYNAYFNNTLKSWKKEGPEQLKTRADLNWEKVRFKD